MTPTPLLGWRTTIVIGALCPVAVLFVVVADGHVIPAVRTAAALLTLLMGIVFMLSIAPVFDNRRLTPQALPSTALPVVGPSVSAVPVAPDPMPTLLEGLYPLDGGNAATQTQELRFVDLDTGELVGDRVTRLEERVDTLTREVVDLGAVVQDQAELTAKAFGTLRREVERIAHVFPEDGEVNDDAA